MPDVDEHSAEQQWLPAIALALLLGGLFAILVGDKVPVPIPAPGANPAYWIGWSPLTGLAVLLYLLIASGDPSRRQTYGIGAGLILLAVLLSGLTAWGRTDDVAILTAIHLPFVVWMVVGWTVSRPHEGDDEPFAYLLKSVETVVAAGLYLMAGMVFVGLTFGIFQVLGVQLPETVIVRVAAFGLGAVPLLALASVYDPHTSPLGQSWSRGLARLVRILPRLMLPAAIGILLIYVLWLVPTRFWQPFEDRSALIAYNATIIAIIVVMSTSVSGIGEPRSERYDPVLHYGILALGLLSILLNAYALGAVVGRILEFGSSLNRHAVIGWNVITLIMLSMLVGTLLPNHDQWAARYRRLLPRLLVPTAIWAVWILFPLPRL